MSGQGEGAALLDHLGGGVTHVVRCWEVTRPDGLRLGFTDHDRDLAFGGLTFRADTGLTARALEQGSGLSVDNSEALGALSDAAISEADIEAGRYDGAEVLAWLVNWQDITARQVLFRGTIGEIRRAGGTFQAELRGLSDRLNRPMGRIFQRPCTAVLGDASCRVDTGAPGYAWEGPLGAEDAEGAIMLEDAGGFADGWFARGRLEVTSGAAAGLSGWIKEDRLEGMTRRLTLWEPLRAPLASGDGLRLVAGCDKRFETCREKFDNLLNYQGFPDIPGDDWLVVHPANTGETSGGSRR
ncbi:DUF2163 domain-containing protein [Roseivivax sp. GX 12232]|uniref:DUF2163 domain-containing protein n=1 Tax=Roseivivax sp. GX 12232 TaxID=2900547 RepID=UPI001E55D9E6|nr:DUF2163 domain-containing protein [Roseivivax sp. GX 12232]MCE0504362.1 DUF2163 domain-containing protein [Roseivivax sp. GX 12232]